MNYVSVYGEKYFVKGDHLDIAEIDLERFSDIKGIKNFRNLKSLNLGGNIIDDLNGIQTLRSLEILYLNVNQLGKIKYLN